MPTVKSLNLPFLPFFSCLIYKRVFKLVDEFFQILIKNTRNSIISISYSLKVYAFLMINVKY